ncbi:LANO_0F13234g1_1 [Lachancea nothofagi CBS 11611]|uniref:LANO_0F13234g1_1 n=1 Tax=Lachancea nothofagi CBS 11611 TaxID=1266666 RepID=A0A1G4KBN0_9SACH|nr:LANO_0F13234g1_1 [Lachancea nothofagi CBS 11611]
MSTLKRSPLKETNSNVKTGLNDMVKKRSVERLEIQHRKRARTTDGGRSRTIEGAVQQHRHADFKKMNDESESQNATKNTKIAAKVTPQDLLEWQTNWRRIMRRDTKIYFDTTDASHKNEKKRDLLRRGFASLGAQMTSFFDTDVTIVITQRVLRDYDHLPETDVVARAAKRYMKIWNYDKATRFLTNLDVDLESLESKTPLGPSTLSNLLHNEKIYGPTDRDPKAKRDDVHYFKYAHVYLYDLWQVWAPVIIAEWRPQELSNPDRLPYPTVKPGSFGRCPFIGDGQCDESSAKRIMKRYKRDHLNEKFALHLRILYQRSAEPQIYTYEEIKELKPLMLPHNYPNSQECHQKLMAAAQPHDESRSNISVESINSKVDSARSATLKPPSKAIWKTPAHNQPVLLLSRQDTEDMADDLCRKKPRIPQEIKASGVVQSNDGSTVQGNGLGPTRASVMNKNMKSLNRLVVDKKFNSAMNTPTLNPAGTSQDSHVAGVTGATTTTTTTATKACVVVEETIASTTNRTATITAAEQAKPKEKKQDARKNDVKLGAGYCENCRVKYECLAEHIESEKHLEFAHDDMNFEAIDSLIEKLAASRAFAIELQENYEPRSSACL